MVCIRRGISGTVGGFVGPLKPVHHRHDQIENDEVGFEFLGFGNGLLTILGDNNFKGPRTLQQHAQGSPDRRIILGNEYSDGHANR